MKVGNLEEPKGWFVPNPRTDHRGKSDESGNIRDREGTFRKGKNRSPRLVVPDEYVPVSNSASERGGQEQTVSVGQPAPMQVLAEVSVADAHAETAAAYPDDQDEPPKNPGKDAWEYATDAVDDASDRTGGDARRKESLFPEIAKVREEILEKAISDLTVSGNALGSRVSSDILQKLGSLRGDRRAERIREIISDPTKNSKQILAELNTMKNESNPAPESVPGRVPDPDTLIITDALSEIDAARAEKDRRDAENPKKEQASGKVPLSDVQEYLSEFERDYFPKFTHDKRIDSDNVPSFILDKFNWKDGRPLRLVISSKDRSVVESLLKDMGAKLKEAIESEKKHLAEITDRIDASLAEVGDSLDEMARAESGDVLKEMKFPVPIKRMKELGLADLPDRLQTTLKNKQKELLKGWGEAKDAARKRLKVALSKKTRKQKEKIVPVASESPKEAEVSEPDTRKAEEIALDEVERIRAEVLEEVRAAGEAGDRAMLQSIKKSDRWRLYDPERFGSGELPEEERQKIASVFSKGNNESAHIIKGAIDGWVDRIEKQGVAPVVSASEAVAPEQPNDSIADLAEEIASVEANLHDKEPVEKGAGGSESAPVDAVRDAKTFDEFYFAVRQMEGLHEDGRPDNVLSGDGWGKLLHTMESHARKMDEEEYLHGHWRDGIPEMLRSKFIELLDAERDYEKNPVGGVGRFGDESADRSVDGAVPIDSASDVFHARRAKETDASVQSAEFVEKKEKIASLKEKIASLNAEISEKEPYQAELETKRNAQREESVRLSLLRAEYEKRFRSIFLKVFTNENRLGQFDWEEKQAKKKLEEMDAEWMEKKEELKYLHADLSEAIHDLEQLTEEEGLSDTFARESVAKAFGLPLESVGAVVDGGDDDSAVERPDPFVEAVADGTSTESIPEIRAEEVPKAVPVEITTEEGEGKKNDSVMASERDADEDAVSRWEGEGGAVIAEKEIQEPVKPDIPKKEGKIYESAASRFKGEFNIFEDDLASVGFKQLSEGQQLLVLENLKQYRLRRVETESTADVDKDVSKAGLLSKFFHLYTKEFKVARQGKKKWDEIKHGGMKEYGTMLMRLVSDMREHGPEVTPGKDDPLDIEIQFLPHIDGLSKHGMERVDRFNDAANAFAKIPYEWSLDTASEEERGTYDRVKTAYDMNLHEAWNVLSSEENTAEGLQEKMNEAERQIAMTRFLQTNPDIGKRLGEIENVSMTQALLKTLKSSPVQFMTLGYIGRAVGGWATGYIAAPLISGVLAKWRETKRAEADVKTSRKLARRGKQGKNAENMKEAETLLQKLGREALPGVSPKDIIPADRLVRKIEHAVGALQSSEGEQRGKRANIVRYLAEHSKERIERGLVNFGEGADGAYNQMKLLQMIAQAETASAMFFKDVKGAAVFENRLEKFFVRSKRREEETEERFIKKRVRNGLVMSTGFSVAGALLREAQEQGWFSGAWRAVSDRLAVPEGSKGTLNDAFGTLPKQEPTVEPSAYLKSMAEPIDAAPAPGPSVPAVPKPDAPAWSPLSKEDWNAVSEEGGSTKAPYQVRENHIPDGESALSKVKGAALPKPAESVPVGFGTGVEANVLHGRVSPFVGTEPDMSPDEQAKILNTDQPVADQGGLNQATVDEIARQDAAELEALQKETLPGRTGGADTSGSVDQPDTEPVSPAIADSWNESVEKAKLGTENEWAHIGKEVPAEVSLDSQDPGTGFRAHEGVDVDAVSQKTGGTMRGDAVADHLPKQTAGASNQTAQEYTQEKIGGSARSAAEISPELKQSVEHAATSDIARGYLIRHPDKLPLFQKLSGDYDASIFESARGETGMRGVRSMAELNDKVEAGRVVRDCLQLLRDPLTPSYEIKTYQLANSLNFDQMKNVGEFVVKASEQFGKTALPVGNEPLRGYIERITAMLTESGKTMKLNGDISALKQLALLGGKK